MKPLPQFGSSAWLKQLTKALKHKSFNVRPVDQFTRDGSFTDAQNNNLERAHGLMLLAAGSNKKETP